MRLSPVSLSLLAMLICAPGVARASAEPVDAESPPSAGLPDGSSAVKPSVNIRIDPLGIAATLLSGNFVTILDGDLDIKIARRWTLGPSLQFRRINFFGIASGGSVNVGLRANFSFEEALASGWAIGADAHDDIPTGRFPRLYLFDAALFGGYQWFSRSGLNAGLLAGARYRQATAQATRIGLSGFWPSIDFTLGLAL